MHKKTRNLLASPTTAAEATLKSEVSAIADLMNCMMGDFDSNSQIKMILLVRPVHT